jgi:hypothetical protein
MRASFGTSRDRVSQTHYTVLFEYLVDLNLALDPVVFKPLCTIQEQL